MLYDITAASMLRGGVQLSGGRCFKRSPDRLGEAISDLSVVGQKQAMPSLYRGDRIRLWARVQHFFSSF